MRNGAILVVLLFGLTDADAEAEASDDLAAADVASAPAPGEESGRIDSPIDDVSIARKVGRVVLFVPKTLLEVAFLPVRGAAWAYDRYKVPERKRRLLFNDAQTLGFSPTLRLESNYGVTVGGRFVHRDLFGAREQMSLRTAAGGRFDHQVGFDLRSGQRFGDRAAGALRGEIDRRSSERFYGIGNSDMGTETRYRQELERVSTLVDVRTFDKLHLRGAAALTELDYAPGGGLALETVYDPTMAGGYLDGRTHVYGELELAYDSRRRAHAWDATVLPATGGLAMVYGGRVKQLAAGDDYWRTGFALQRFFWLGVGPRVLALRGQAEAVTGDYEDVAFSELPQLGGKMLLRGYPIDRFRDRVAAIGSFEYLWDLNENLVTSLFVDAGRVMPSIDELALSDLRVGYGMGLQIVTQTDFIAEISLASSRDGGLFLNLAFDPVFDIDPRVMRR